MNSLSILNPKELVESVNAKYSSQYYNINPELYKDFSEFWEINLNNALNDLAIKIYSRDSHFIFELIQNVRNNAKLDKSNCQILIEMSSKISH